MKKNKILKLIVACVCFFSLAGQASVRTNNFIDDGSYIIGVAQGYASSDWGFLASNDPDVQMSAPSSAQDGGGSISAFIGYQFSKYLLAEINYVYLQTSTINFAYGNIYHAPTSWDAFSMNSKTELVDTFAQFNLPVFSSDFFVFSDIGMSITHRKDEMLNRWHVGPLFGGGLGYNMDDGHVFNELGFQYTAGTAKSNLLPAQDYIPFTYFIYYQFGFRI